jgi:stage V sporulation protein G
MCTTIISKKEVSGAMNITDVRVKKVGNEGKLKAYVSVTFDDSFVVHNLKVINGQSGIFVAMPSRKTTSGEFKDVAHPINSAFREILQKAVLEAYNREVEEQIRREKESQNRSNPTE